MLKQFAAGCAVVWEYANANTGGHDHAPTRQLNGVFEAVHDALGHTLCFVAVVNVDQYAELIPTKACDHICMSAGCTTDLASDGLKQLISRVMAQAVIDAFEVIYIKKQDG